MTKAILNTLFISLLLAYPVLIYFGLQHFSLSSIAPLLLIAIIGRYFFSKSASNTMPWLLPATLLGSACVLFAWLLNNSKITLFYPVLISATMLVTFAYSLVKGPSVIESFALLDEKRKAKYKENVTLPSHVVAYTRNVTKVWCGFFSINIIIATYTILSDDLALWTLYNGLVAYILMGLFMAGELVVRHFAKKRHGLQS